MTLLVLAHTHIHTHINRPIFFCLSPPHFVKDEKDSIRRSCFFNDKNQSILSNGTCPYTVFHVKGIFIIFHTVFLFFFWVSFENDDVLYVFAVPFLPNAQTHFSLNFDNTIITTTKNWRQTKAYVLQHCIKSDTKSRRKKRVFSTSSSSNKIKSNVDLLQYNS